MYNYFSPKINVVTLRHRACLTDIVYTQTHADKFHINTPLRHSMEEAHAEARCEHWAYHLWADC